MHITAHPHHITRQHTVSKQYCMVQPTPDILTLRRCCASPHSSQWYLLCASAQHSSLQYPTAAQR